MADIPGDITTTAVFESQIYYGSSFGGQFETTGDVDWIKVSLVAGTAYSFYASAELTAGGSGDAALQLFDATGTQQLAADDNGGVGLNSVIHFTAASTGTYFIGVHDVNGSTGQYTVGITGIAATDHLLTTGDDTYTGVAGERALGGAGQDNIDVGAGQDALGDQGDDKITGN